LPSTTASLSEQPKLQQTLPNFPPQATPRRISETLLQSSVAPPRNPQHNPSPPFTPETLSLCQAPRSRISRTAVSHSRPVFPSTALFGGARRPLCLCLCHCGGVGDVTLRLPMDLLVLVSVVGPRNFCRRNRSQTRSHSCICWASDNR
jgi:hypothetical protein